MGRILQQKCYKFILLLHIFCVLGERNLVSLNSFLCIPACSSPSPLEAMCLSLSYGMTQYHTFYCLASNNLESQTCSLDDREAEPCNSHLTLSADKAGIGEHSLLVRWTDVCGQTAQQYFSFKLYPSQYPAHGEYISSFAFFVGSRCEGMDG